MNLAKLSANGQITVPAEVRRRLHLVPGDKVLFVEKPNGEVVVAKAGLAALAQAQVAFAGAAADFGVSGATTGCRGWSMTCAAAIRDPGPGRHQYRHLGSALPAIGTGASHGLGAR